MRDRPHSGRRPGRGFAGHAAAGPVLSRGAIAEFAIFLDAKALFPLFGLPLRLPAGAPDPV